MPLFFVVSGYLTHKEREENFKKDAVSVIDTFQNVIGTFSGMVYCAKYFVMEQYLILYQIFIGGGIGSFSHCGGAMC